MIKTPENPETTETPASKKEKTSYRGFRRLRKLITPGESLSQRVVQAGFSVKVDDYVTQLSDDVIRKYGLMKDENIYFCSKPSLEGK